MPNSSSLNSTIYFQNAAKVDTAGRRESKVGLCVQRMKELFEETDEIVELRLWLNSWKWIHGVVQFQNAEHAGKLLEKQEHKLFEGYKGLLYVMDPTDMLCPETTRARCQFYVKRRFEITESPESREEANVLNLNDDCIQEIFERLNVLDLCLVAEVCQRFKTNAQKRFAIQHKSFHFFEIVTLDSDRMNNFMECFGPFVENLEVSSVFLHDEMGFPHMLMRHFTSLNALTLHEFNLNDAIAEKLKPLFVRLRKLCFIECEVGNAVSQN